MTKVWVRNEAGEEIECEMLGTFPIFSPVPAAVHPIEPPPVEPPPVEPPPVEPPPVEPPKPDPETFTIVDADWTAEHDKARGVGHRRITVQAVPLPEAHSLKVQSWSNTAKPKPDAAGILPGGVWTSGSAMAANTECHNSLWLFRESDKTVTRQVTSDKTFLTTP